MRVASYRLLLVALQQGFHFLRQRVAGDLREVSQALGIGRFRIGMRPPKEWHLQIIQQSRDRFVRFHHEHFDDLVREGIILRLRVDDVPLLSQPAFEQ